MPKCTFFDDNLLDGIDLTDRSLIVSYSVWDDCKVNTQKYTWAFENTNQIYVFDIVTYVTPNDTWAPKTSTLVRSAILVDHISESARMDVFYRATTANPID